MRSVVVGFAIAIALCQPVSARQTVWDLPLGAAAGALPDGFTHFACGSDGGPPLARLYGWAEFGHCKADAEGLREVYFEYDDSLAERARAEARWAPLGKIGTIESYFPVIASALFDAYGTLVGVRLVTDPRPDERPDDGLPRPRPRGEHYLLGLYLMDRLGMSETDCRDEPPGERESPVIGQFVKRTCARTDAATGRRFSIVTHYLRKAGLHDIDPTTGRLSEGEFESWTRAEVRLIR